MIDQGPSEEYIGRKLRCDECKVQGIACYRLSVGLYAGCWHLCDGCMPRVAERELAILAKHPSMLRMLVFEIRPTGTGWWDWKLIAKVKPRKTR